MYHLSHFFIYLKWATVVWLKRCMLHRGLLAPLIVVDKSHLWWFCHLSLSHSSPLCLHRPGSLANRLFTGFWWSAVFWSVGICGWGVCTFKCALCALQVAADKRVTDTGRLSCSRAKECNRWQILPFHFFFSCFLTWISSLELPGAQTLYIKLKHICRINCITRVLTELSSSSKYCHYCIHIELRLQPPTVYLIWCFHKHHWLCTLWGSNTSCTSQQARKQCEKRRWYEDVSVDAD